MLLLKVKPKIVWSLFMVRIKIIILVQNVSELKHR